MAEYVQHRAGGMTADNATHALDELAAVAGGTASRKLTSEHRERTPKSHRHPSPTFRS